MQGDRVRLPTTDKPFAAVTALLRSHESPAVRAVTRADRVATVSRMKAPGRRIVACTSALSLVAFTATASAHISLEQGGTHKSRMGESMLKDAPCGQTGGTRGENIYTYKAGETIEIKLIETIPHPGYFRIAFDDDGDDDFVEPASIKPVDPARPCPFNAADKCGESDFDNSPEVLMDNLDAHLAGAFGTTYSWQVKLPDVSCDNCTLQVMQVMEDTIHGAYNPVAGDPADTPYVADNYHQCIDLVLTGGSVPAAPGSAAPSSDDGGCSVARSSSRGGELSGLFLLAAGAVFAHRRRAVRGG